MSDPVCGRCGNGAVASYAKVNPGDRTLWRCLDCLLGGHGPAPAPKLRQYIRTRHGQKIEPLNPNPKRIRLADIAHALSQNNRFCGHTLISYSVGQHSIYCALVAWMRGLSQQTQLACLLHDASEAYMSDIAKPLKYTDTFKLYREAEARLQACIFQKFGLPPVESRVVKHIDQRMLATELSQLMPQDEPLPFLPYDFPIVELRPRYVREVFMRAFKAITDGPSLAGIVALYGFLPITLLA